MPWPTLAGKFYFINVSWNFLFLACVYNFWVETVKVSLEEVAMKFGDLRPEAIVDGIDRQDSSDHHQRGSGEGLSGRNDLRQFILQAWGKRTITQKLKPLLGKASHVRRGDVKVHIVCQGKAGTSQAKKLQATSVMGQ